MKKAHVRRSGEAEFSERFSAVLPQFSVLLEGEWRARRWDLSAAAEAAFRQAHSGLGKLIEILDEQGERSAF